MPAVVLETLTWPEAEQLLKPDTVVVIPLGSACKEHGPHLPLNNDWLIAEYLKQRVLNSGLDVVVAPTVGYSFYPAFIEYPGSITLGMETACQLIVDICQSIAAHGPRRFYVINTGISTTRPLTEAAARLEANGVLLRFTDLDHALADCTEHIQQEGGSHADEIETSMMLYIAPDAVNMSKAVKDFHHREGRLTRKPEGPGAYSPSGVWGDPTLATFEKGKIFVERLTATVLDDIKDLAL